MRDSLKIAFGIFLGLLAVALCGACAFAATTLGGLSLLGSLLSPAESTPVSPRSLLHTPESPASSTPPIGHIMQCDDLGLRLVRFELSPTCPGGTGQPAPGAKFLVVWLTMANLTDQVMELPDISLALGAYEPGLGSAGECRYNQDSFGNACWQWNGQLFPGVVCEGWELFEVPLSLDEGTAILNASFQDLETSLVCEAQWPLSPPQ